MEKTRAQYILGANNAILVTIQDLLELKQVAIGQVYKIALINRNTGEIGLIQEGSSED